MTIPANMSAQAATGSTTWCNFKKLKLHDGLIIAVTDHDLDLTFDIGDGDGAVTYYASDAVEISTARAATDLAIDQIEIIGAVESTRIREDDLHGGRYNNAFVTAFQARWDDPAGGQKIEFRGSIGEVESAGEEFRVEILSLIAHYQRLHGFTLNPMCPKSFGSTAATERYPLMPCGVALKPATWAASTAYVATLDGDQLIGNRVSPSTPNGFVYRASVGGTSGGSEPTWPTTVGGTVVDGGVTWTAERALAHAGTVSVVTSQMQITATGISIAADTFARGEIEWLTGNNAGVGLNTPIRTDDGAGVLTFYQPPIRQIQIGDTFTAFRGCDRSRAACIGFSNWKNFLGHPELPPRTV